MPAVDSKRLDTLQALKTRFEGITGAEYHYPVVDAKQVSIDPSTNILAANSVDLPLYVFEMTPEGSKVYQAGEHLVEIVRVNLFARMNVSNLLDTGARAQVWENLAADAEKAIALDVTLGGLVYDTRLLVPQPFIGVGSPVVIVLMPLELRIHRRYGEP